MEVSSHALAMGRVDGTTYDVAVFTNLSQDHLDFHADLEEYFAVKATLFTPERSRLGVIDVDDPYGRRLVGLAGVPVVTVSPSGGAADWRAEDVELGPHGSRFVLAGPDGVRLPLRDRRWPATSTSPTPRWPWSPWCRPGWSPEQAAAGVASCTGVPGRMERVDAGSSGPLALVDFAHSPDALERLLVTARGLVADRRPARRRPRLRRRPRPAASGRRWVRSRCAAPTSSCSPATTRAPRTRWPSSPRSAAGAEQALAEGAARAGSRSSRTGGRPSPLAASLAGPGRRRRGGRQGSRDRPGDGRGRAPVRRPGRARARRSGRSPP